MFFSLLVFSVSFVDVNGAAHYLTAAALEMVYLPSTVSTSRK